MHTNTFARINLDYASMTPILPEVREAMMAAWDEGGNPSAIHHSGREARKRLEQVRAQVAALINAKPEEIYFTSCGTESNNWALRGLMNAHRGKGRHLIISAIEHPSIGLSARRLEQEGISVTILKVDTEGVVSPAALKAVLRSDTSLVSIMLANGEVGTIEPIRELAAIAHEQGALFHTDAVAAVGSIPIDVKGLGVDVLSLAANTFYGPQGAAALYLREGVRILPLLEGGGQESGNRSGTEALPALIGMGKAAQMAREEIPQRVQHLSRLRDRLREGLKARIESLRFNGSWSSRLPHNLHCCVEGLSSESLVLGLDQAGIAPGLGSACNSKAMRPSAVLKAMGFSEEQAKGALVLTVGVLTTEEEIDRAVTIIPEVVEKLRRVVRVTIRVS